MKQNFFDDFWQSSALDEYSIRQFVEKMDSFESDNKQLQLEYPELAKPFKQTAKTKLDKISQKRRSSREFSQKPLSQKQLSRLLGSARAWGGLEHRTYPSAGASYANEIFILSWGIKGLEDKVLYYDADSHGVVELPEILPQWESVGDKVNISVSGRPACLVVSVLFTDRLTAKYGERGGRFALLEAGAVMQQLSLSVAEQNLAGVVAGGLADKYWLNTIGLTNTSAKLGFGLLIGNSIDKK